jgi:hypothetical protein
MKQLLTSHTSGWIVLTALLVSSGHLAGCDTSAPSQRDGAQEVLPAKQATPPKLTERKEQSAAPTAQKTLAPEDQKEAEGEALPEKAQEETAVLPLVSRLVIASDVKEREPIELTDAKVEEPVVAFVELKNASDQDSGVVVTFEHADGKKVGFVELTVPGKSSRYRTWARTRNIKTPGE